MYVMALLTVCMEKMKKNVTMSVNITQISNFIKLAYSATPLTVAVHTITSSVKVEAAFLCLRFVTV